MLIKVIVNLLDDSKYYEAYEEQERIIKEFKNSCKSLAN